MNNPPLWKSHKAKWMSQNTHKMQIYPVKCSVKGGVSSISADLKKGLKFLILLSLFHSCLSEQKAVKNVSF